MSDARGLAVPIEGQSHWCDSKKRNGRFCLNIVRNDSKQCAAGHKNKLRPMGVTHGNKISEPVLAAPVHSGREIEDLAVLPRGSAMESGASAGWSHEEGKKHTVTERLRERCSTYAGGATCSERGISPEDWCERCLAVDKIEDMRTLLGSGRELVRALRELGGLDPEGPLYYSCLDWLRKTQNI